MLSSLVLREISLSRKEKEISKLYNEERTKERSNAF